MITQAPPSPAFRSSLQLVGRYGAARRIVSSTGRPPSMSSSSVTTPFTGPAIAIVVLSWRYEASRPGNAWVLPRQNAARSAELCMASAPNVRNRWSLTATRPR